MTVPENLKATADWLRRRIAASIAERGASTAPPELSDGALPSLAVITGSGLGGFADAAAIDVSIEFNELPGMSAGDVPGHDSRWMTGRLGGTALHLVLGRRHLYEGAGGEEVILAVRLLALLGVRLIVMINAAGGLSGRLWPGDLMLIRDHINLTFRNPLLGPNAEEFGPRFPDMSEPYHRAAQATLRRSALAEGIDLKQGVYGAMMGPAFESPAEARALARLGVDAVGMSTVPEVLAARHAGMGVVALSLITNSHVRRDSGPAPPVTHEDVLAEASRSQDRLRRLLLRAFPLLDALARSPAFAAEETPEA